uniref:Uncharacterized protein n=1 Tax=Schizaphis graminum TaxID=13262 RepID=A0A2S2PRV6_SCHGA
MMNSTNEDDVTTPGASEPQGSAVVSGSGVYTGSQVAGSSRSSSDHREGTGVASLAPATQPTTSAEIGVSQAGTSKLCDKLKAAKSVKKSSTQEAFASLKSTIEQQYKTINGILKATDHLQSCKEKSRSPVILEAIKQVTGATENLRTLTESLHSAFYEAEIALTRETYDQKSGTDVVTPALAETRAAIIELRAIMEKQGALLEGLSKQVERQHQQRPAEARTSSTDAPTRNAWKNTDKPQNPLDQPQCSSQSTGVRRLFSQGMPIYLKKIFKKT